MKRENKRRIKRGNKNIDEIKEQVADDVVQEYIEDKRGEMQYEEMKDEGLL